MRELHQDLTHPSPMTTLGHLGESSVLNLHISYIEDNAYFMFGGIGGIFPLFLNFPATSIVLSFVFSFRCFYVVSVFRSIFFIFRLFLFWLSLFWE